MIDFIRIVIILSSIGLFAYIVWQNHLLTRYSSDDTISDTKGSLHTTNAHIDSRTSDSSTAPKWKSNTDKDLPEYVPPPREQKYDPNKLNKSEHRITLRIKSSSGEYFHIEDIKKFIQKEKLKPGAPGIYYLYEKDERDKHLYNIVFCLTNGEEPGSLTEYDLNNLKTKQLMLFFDGEQSVRPVAHYDKLIDLTKKLSSKIGGTIFGSNKEEIKENDIRNERSRLQKYYREKKNMIS